MSANRGSTVARDGTRISYAVLGDRGPYWVLVNGYGTTDFYWRYLIPHFRDRVRFVTWDLKGHGASEPARSEVGCSIPEAADDLRRVMDAAGVHRAALLAFSLGCQIILEAWRHIPDRAAETDIAEAYGVRGIPSLFLLDRDGTLAAMGRELRVKGLEPAVKKALDTKKQL